MNSLVRFNLQTAGRDKLARLVQYASRAVWYLIQESETNPHAVDKLKSLEYTLSTFRKLLRLGRCLDSFYGTLKSIHYEDITVRVTCTLSKIANALFLLADHMLWIGRSGLYSVDTPKWSRLQSKYWLYSVVMNLIRDVYEILRILEQEKIRFHPATSVKKFVSSNVVPVASTFANNHKDVLWDTIKNGCDVWIPLTALGYTKLKPGTIGVLGVISSIAGIVALVSPAAKLVPS